MSVLDQILFIPGIGSASPSPVSYPLDDVAGAVAAYDLWKRRSGYSGSAIRVKRTSDSTEQDIGFSGVGLDTAALETFCAGTDGYVVTWYDQAANGDDITIATNSLQIVDGGTVLTDANGRPRMKYVGDGETLSATLTATTATTQDCTIFAVIQPAEEIATQDYILRLVATGASTAREQVGLLSAGRDMSIHVADADSNTQFNDMANVGFHHGIYAVDVGTTTVRMYQQLDMSHDDTHAEGAVTLENVEIGSDGAPAFYLQELIVYPQLSDEDRETVYAALNAQHQIGPTALTAGALLPERYRWQADLRAWIGTLTTDDLDVTPAAFTWDSTYDDVDDLSRMWLGLTYDTASLYVGDDLWSESKWYMLDDGASAGIEGSGALLLPHKVEPGHNYLLATPAAWLYTFSITKATGDGNPFLGNANMARRGLVHTAAYTSYWLAQLEGSTTASGNDTIDITSKVCIPAAKIYHDCNGVLDATTKQAFRDMFVHWLNWMIVETPDQNNNGNLIAESLQALSYIYMAFPTDTALRQLVSDVRDWHMFGRPDGNTTTLAYPRAWHTTHVAEGGGCDQGYTGRSEHSFAEAAAVTDGESDWDPIRTALQTMTEWRTYLYGQENGDLVSGTGYASRTGGDDQQGNTDRYIYQATQYTEGRPLAADRVTDTAGMVSAITTAIANLNANDHEKAISTIHGWDDSLTTATPPALTRRSVWPQDIPFYPPSAWHATYKALVDATDATTQYPQFRSAGHSKALGLSSDPWMWSYKGDDGAGTPVNFGFLLAAQDTTGSVPNVFDGWTGGQLAYYWHDGIGAVIRTLHGKGGGAGNGDEAIEDSKRWHVIDRWPATHVFSGAKYEIVDKTGDMIEIAGDQSDLFIAGESYVVTETSGDNTLGTFTIAGGGVTYNGVSGNTEITLTSSTGVDIGDYIGFMFSTAHCHDSTAVSFTGGATPTQVVVTATLNNGNSSAGTGPFPAGTVACATTYSIVSSNLRVALSITADATAQTEYTPRIDWAIPLYLRDPDSAATGDASIKYHDGSGWVTLTTTPVSTQYIRLGRDYGSGEQYAWIKFDTSQTVMLSDAVYQQPAYDNDRMRNVIVDLHAARDTPTLWPGTAVTCHYDMLTQDPGLPDTMEVTITKPTASINYLGRTGALWYARWTFTANGNTLDEIQLEYSTDYAGDEGAASWSRVVSWTDITGASNNGGITDEGSGVYSYVGPGDATDGGGGAAVAVPSGLTAIRVRVLNDAVTPDEVTAVVAVTGTAGSSYATYDFTETNGTTVETTTTLTTGGNPVWVGPSTARIEVQSNQGEGNTAADHGCQFQVNAGSDQQLVEATVNWASSGAVDVIRGVGVAARGRVSHAQSGFAHVKGVLYKSNAGGNPMTLGLRSSAATDTEDVSASVNDSTSYVVRCQAGDDVSIASIWTTGGTFIAEVHNWTPFTSYTGANAHGAGIVNGPWLDDWAVYTY